MMKWESNIINAHMELGRCLYEINRKGLTHDDFDYQKEPRKDYILAHVKSAILDLQNALKELENTLF